jgi:tetratricopeptide (TPR) repeat protein
MSGFLELIKATEDRLRREHDVDAGMDAVIESISTAVDPTETVAITRKLLRRRIRALHAAADQLTQVSHQIEQLAGLLHLLPEGWESRRKRIDADLAANPATGLATWLSDWYDAASRQRWDAVDRLVTDVSLPDTAHLLLERMRLAQESIASGQCVLARPVLEAGLDGFELGGRHVPNEETSGRLAGLLARLSLANDPSADPADLLRRALNQGSSTTAVALAARWHRLQGDLAQSERWLDQVEAEDHTDLDVAVELIERARRQGKASLAAEVAAAAVEAVPIVSHIEMHLRALLYPPPVELWIAMAERALLERDLEGVDTALEKGLETAEWTDNPSRARLAELRAAVAEQRGAKGEQVQALVDAGSERLWSGAPDAGMPHFEKALTLEPGHTGAQLLLADSLLVSAGALPLRIAKPRLQRALSLLTSAQARRAVEPHQAWSYTTESYARQSLLNDLDPGADREAWPALLAACRGLASDLGDWTRWLTLADALAAMRAHELALDVARHVRRTLGDDAGMRRMAAEKYANTGYPDKAIRALEPLDGYDEEARRGVDAVRAYCILRLGDPAEAASLLRRTELDPEWAWATESLVSALLLTGRMPEVMSEVASLERHWSGRLDERSAASSMASVHLLQGRFDAAADLCEKLDDRAEDAVSLLATARLLQGRREEAVALFESWLRTSATRRALAEWELLTAPQIRVLAVHYGVPLADLQDLNRLADELLTGHAWPEPPGPSGRVGRFQADPEDGTARLATVMCGALVRFARGDATAAAAGLSDQPLDELSDTLFQFLKKEATERDAPEGAASEVPLASPPAETEATPEQDADERLALDVVAALRDGRQADANQAIEALRQRDSAEEVGLQLRLAAESDYELYDDVMRLVESFVGRDQLSESAGALLGRLREWTALRLVLPPSWFAGHEDPVATHPIFLRYIPEARFRTEGLPGVRVSTDEELEPDGYQVLNGIEVLETGRVDPRGRYTATESALMATSDTSSVRWAEVVPGIVAVPLAVDPALPGELFLMTADEVVVRRTEREFQGVQADG